MWDLNDFRKENPLVFIIRPFLKAINIYSNDLFGISYMVKSRSIRIPTP